MDNSQFVPSDQSLIEKVLQGEVHQFDKLVTRYRNHVFRFILKQINEPAHAEDLTQDTFVAAYQSINSFNNQSKLLTWFLGIARNKVRNEFNRGGKFRAQTISDDVLPEHQSREASPLEIVEQKQVYYELKLAIDQLSPDLQEALILVVMEGLCYEDVSKIMNIPVGTVKSKVFRARMTLKEKMEK